MGNTTQAPNSPSYGSTTSSNASPNSATEKGHQRRRTFSQIFQRRKSSIKNGSSLNGTEPISQSQSFNRLKEILTFYYKFIEENTTMYRPRYSMSRQASLGINNMPQHIQQDSIMSVGIPADLLQLTTNMSLPTLDAPQMSPISMQEILQKDEERKQMESITYQPPKKKKGKKGKEDSKNMYDYINSKVEKGSYSNQDLLNDFNHLLKYYDNDDDFEYIYNNLIGAICKECDINQCLMVQRNYRNRINLANDFHIDKRNDMYFQRNNVVDSDYPEEDENEDNSKEINIQQILDKIHCYYYHSYQMGFRLNTNIKLMISDADNEDESKSNKPKSSRNVDIYQFLEEDNLDENEEVDDTTLTNTLTLTSFPTDSKIDEDEKENELSMTSKDGKLLSLRDILKDKKKNYLQIRNSSRFKQSPTNNRYFSRNCDEFNNADNPRYFPCALPI